MVIIDWEVDLLIENRIRRLIISLECQELKLTINPKFSNLVPLQNADHSVFVKHWERNHHDNAHGTILIHGKDVYLYKACEKDSCDVTTLPRRQNQRSDIGGCVYDDTNFIVGGGRSESCNATNATEMFDLKTMIWKTIGPFKYPRRSPILATVEDKVYLFGGESEQVGNQVEEIEILENGKWSESGKWVRSRLGCNCLYLKDTKKIIFIGGIDKAGTELRDIDIFVATSERWIRELPKLRVGRSNPVCLCLPLDIMNGSVLILGGLSPDALSSAELFNPVTHKLKHITLRNDTPFLFDLSGDHTSVIKTHIRVPSKSRPPSPPLLRPLSPSRFRLPLQPGMPTLDHYSIQSSQSSIISEVPSATATPRINLFNAKIDLLRIATGGSISRDEVKRFGTTTTGNCPGQQGGSCAMLTFRTAASRQDSADDCQTARERVEDIASSKDVFLPHFDYRHPRMRAIMMRLKETETRGPVRIARQEQAERERGARFEEGAAFSCDRANPEKTKLRKVGEDCRHWAEKTETGEPENEWRETAKDEAVESRETAECMTSGYYSGETTTNRPTTSISDTTSSNPSVVSSFCMLANRSPFPSCERCSPPFESLMVQSTRREERRQFQCFSGDHYVPSIKETFVGSPWQSPLIPTRSPPPTSILGDTDCCATTFLSKMHFGEVSHSPPHGGSTPPPLQPVCDTGFVCENVCATANRSLSRNSLCLSSSKLRLFDNTDAINEFGFVFGESVNWINECQGDTLTNDDDRDGTLAAAADTFTNSDDRDGTLAASAAADTFTNDDRDGTLAAAAADHQKEDRDGNMMMSDNGNGSVNNPQIETLDDEAKTEVQSGDMYRCFERAETLLVSPPHETSSLSYHETGQFDDNHPSASPIDLQLKIADLTLKLLRELSFKMKTRRMKRRTTATRQYRFDPLIWTAYD